MKYGLLLIVLVLALSCKEYTADGSKSFPHLIVQKNRKCPLHSDTLQVFHKSDTSEVIQSTLICGKIRVWMRSAPKIKLECKDGDLLGYNRGEWGGGLVFKSRKTDSLRLIIDDNIKSVYPVKNGFIVLTGLAHLSYDGGSVYCVHRDINDNFITRKLHTLPSSPKQSQLLKNGEVIVSLRNNECFIINSNSDLIKTKSIDLSESMK